MRENSIGLFKGKRVHNYIKGMKQKSKLRLVFVCITLVIFTALCLTLAITYVNQKQSEAIVQGSKATASAKAANALKTPQKESRIIKIAITRDGFWFPSRTSNATDGYGGEYLKAIEKKTGWHFEKKLYPLQDAYTALESGEVDCMAPISYSKERAEQFILMDTPSGTTKSTFYTSPRSLLAYRDYKSFEGKRIGVIKGSSSEGLLKKDAKLNNYSYKPVYFQDNRSLLEGISSGKTDLIIAQSMCVSNSENLKIVNELQETNFFFATSNENIELARKLNEAINSILLANPEFNNTLTKRYLETPDTSEPRFTQDEVSYLRNAPLLRVAYVENLLPYQGTATKKSTSKSGIDGVVGRVLDSVSSKTGLKFQGVAYPTMQEAEEGVKNGEANMMSTYLPAEETYATDGKIISSATYLSTPVVTLSKRNHNISKKPIYGVPYQLRWTLPVLRKEQPNDDYIQYATGSEAFKALKDDELDYLLCGTLMADKLLDSNANKAYKIDDYTPLVDRMCFGISEREDENLVRVINKTVVSFDNGDKNIFVSDATQTSSFENFINFVFANWTAVLLGVAIFLVVVFAILFNVRRRNLKEVEYIAFIDPITGLPNRSKFVDFVAAKIEREEHLGAAVIILDIDSFKSINDMYGMVFGDELLKFLGEKLKNASPDNTFVARDSGDMFLIYIEPCTEDALNETLNAIIHSINRVSFKHAGMLDLSISCGVHLLASSENPNAAINCADIARVKIKDDHGQHIMFFNEEMRAELANQTILENDLKLALERHEFELYYQPKIDLYTQRVVGFEALIRWNHPLAGLLGPAAFIPLAEKVGLIGQITEWVINESCANIAHIKEMWSISRSGLNIPAQEMAKYRVKTGINLSPRDLINPHIIDHITNALKIHEVMPQALEIEITETALLGDTQTTLQTLNDIQKLGITVALDDFGTGYSSLGSLKDLPLNTVKLDRTFIRDIEIDPRGQKMLKSIVNLIKVLDYDLVAEGVEDEYQEEFLKNIGCETAQGFLYAPGMPLNEAYQFFIASLNLEPSQD